MRSHLRKRPHQCFQLCSWHAKFKLAAERRADLCRTTAPRRLRCLDVGSNIKAWAEACHIKGGGTPPSRVNESCSSETSTLRFIALFLRLWALTENRNPQKTAALMLYLYGTTFCRGLIWTYGGCGGLRGLGRGEKCEKRLHFSPCVSGLSLLSLSPPTLITHHHSRQILHMCRHASNVCVCRGVAWSSSPVLLPPQRHAEGERSPCVVWPSVFLLALIEAAERPPVGRLAEPADFQWKIRAHIRAPPSADLVLLLRLRPPWVSLSAGVTERFWWFQGFVELPVVVDASAQIHAVFQTLFQKLSETPGVFKRGRKRRDF